MENLIRKAPFNKLIKEISQEYRICPEGPGTPSVQVRFQSTALAALQEAAENFLVDCLRMLIYWQFMLRESQ